MANSFEISDYKNKVILALLNDEQIVNVINASEEDLVYTHIFPYLYMPETLTVVSTYITMSVDIPKISSNGIWSYPRLTIYIISHQSAMELDIPTVSATRIDYLSGLVDKLLNNNSDFGYGRLKLTSNVESSVNSTHKCRQLTFIATDINDSLCGGI